MIDRNYWKEETIINLADANTIKRGKALAKPKDWALLAKEEVYLWGECKGSTIYRTQVCMEAGAFKHNCSCPVRGAAPCKHAIGLLFYWLSNEGDFKEGNAPDWVDNWRKKHTQAKEKINIVKELSPEALAEQQASKLERRKKRLANMQNGIDELSLWLEDFVTQGVANLPIMHHSYWNNIAKRMVDAQMPRVANYLNETAILLNRTEEWLDILIARIGELYLLVQAFKNYIQSPESMADNDAKQEELSNQLEDLLSTLGTTVMKKDVLAENPPISGEWLVLAITQGTDIEHRAYRKVWLKKLTTEQDKTNAPIALVLDFVFGNAGYEMSYNLGMVYTGDMTYYSSAVPQRAIFQNIKVLPDYKHINIEDLQPFSKLNVLLNTYAEALAKNLWLNEYFVVLNNVYPMLDVESHRAYLQDEAGVQLNLKFNNVDEIYTLLALSGGHGISIFGSLIDSRTFIPFCVYAEEEFIAINTNTSVLTYF